jgi:hypothetical protein
MRRCGNKLKLVACVGVMFAAAPVCAASPQWLYSLIDNSDGYEQISDQILMIEGEDDIVICHFPLAAEMFGAGGTVRCLPVQSLEVADLGGDIDDGTALYDFIDSSEGYVSVGPGVLMIEGEYDIQLCHFALNQSDFGGAGNGAVTCRPLAQAVTDVTMGN